ncbi:magnesium transporter CorA family protein [Furfurilactobacillus rossiae]|uniref:Mg2+ and Co2+ transport protein n=1 Tax=Furfurilactobacillus rossiae DSM 15814 TaxID=1114972 RepID=A0A0R1RHK6_9LACO|nr:magnesium transporter CorA family protein [Furfurilactobacillus rossiae]KRL53139.1 Mg2+ and Co2+ transport protein [Furfurilactobacillus rossiae DSM 15814]QFR66260.1 magnesium transporter CorA family protein [Furfurilactobacillus rossiae]QLE61702.1 Magnesium and cobalt transport protein CorA [Furfurilactobacillus rossiae]
MIEYYANDKNGNLIPVNSPQQDCWINVERPTHDEISQLAHRYDFPETYISAILDDRENSRVDGIDPQRPERPLHLLLQFPKYEVSPLGYLSFTTFPFSFILTDSAVITVSKQPATFINDFIMNPDNATIRIADRQDFILRFGWYIAHSFVHALSLSERETTSLERELTTATRNEQIYKIMGLQKSLVLFDSALKDNRPILDQISSAQDYFNGPHFHELLAQIMIETDQAQSMTIIQNNILEQYSNMVSSVVSNNLNEVMKLLTSVTLIMTIPTIVGGIYGMNVDLPFAHIAHAFSLVMGFTIIVCAITAWILKHHDWF